MTALTEDRSTEFHPEGGTLEESVATGVKIYCGSLVTRSAGYCKPASNTAGESLAGVADHQVDNTLGADGAKKIRLLKKGVRIFAASGLTQADVGKPLWIVDDQTVSRTPGRVYAGTLAYFLSATEAPVSIASAIDNPDPFSRFELHAFWPSTVGASLVTVVDGMEIDERFEVLRGYADAKVAPGGAYTSAVGITNGTTAKSFNLSASVKHAEDEAINQVYEKDQDIDITLQDSSASATTADVNIRYLCRIVP